MPRHRGARMTDRTIEDRVRAVIVDQLGVAADRVTAEAGFVDDLGAESVDAIELVLAFEEEFGQDIPDAEAEKLHRVGDVVRYIEEGRGVKGARREDRVRE